MGGHKIFRTSVFQPAEVVQDCVFRRREGQRARTHACTRSSLLWRWRVTSIDRKAMEVFSVCGKVTGDVSTKLFSWLLKFFALCSFNKFSEGDLSRNVDTRMLGTWAQMHATESDWWSRSTPGKLAWPWCWRRFAWGYCTSFLGSLPVLYAKWKRVEGFFVLPVSLRTPMGGVVVFSGLSHCRRLAMHHRTNLTARKIGNRNVIGQQLSHLHHPTIPSNRSQDGKTVHDHLQLY